MKHIFFFFASLFCANNIFSQTLFSYGNNEISKSEFLRAYNKNKPTTTDKEKSIRDYLILFTNFKLKVKTAEELQLDTITQIKYDVQNFRDQVVDNYMNDENGMQNLVEEASNRNSKDIHTLYFSIPVAADAKSADTLKAYEAANALYKNLKEGKKDYQNLAAENTSKYSLTKYFDIGYITAFSLPYNFESIIYNTKMGSTSSPYKTKKGWIIFKNVAERQAIGKWKVAQLLFAFPPNADNRMKLLVKAKADSVNKLIANGLSFNEAAKNYSDDRMTYLSGGELQEFGAGTYSSEFENSVIMLKKDGDISNPFETAFGYHIVKRLNHAPIATDKKDVAYQYEIKQKIMQDALRVSAVKENFLRDATIKVGYKRNIKISNADLFRVADSILKSKNENNFDKKLSNKIVATFSDGSVVKGEAWISFLKNIKSNAEPLPLSNAEYLNTFNKQNVTDYYKKHLEKYNVDFKYQMQEFKEGNMLFEIMERYVWSKAGADTNGLINYYATHKENYKWAASADVLLFNSSDKSKLTDALTTIKSSNDWTSIVSKSSNTIQADSGRYELSQIPNATEKTIVKTGECSTIQSNNNDGNYSFVKYLRIYEPNMQRTFAEARGLVINDYQMVLEQRWIDELKKKYPVKINQAVVSEIIK